MRVGQKMTHNPVTVGPTDTLDKAAKKMNAGRFRRLPVVEKGDVVGILTDRDLRQNLSHLDRTKISAVMSKPVVTVTPLTTLEHATHLMLQHKIGGLPVVDDHGALVGMITASDMLGAFLSFVGAAGEDSSRIDVSLAGDAERIAAAAEIAAQQSGEVLGLGTYRVENEESPVFYVRVRSDDIGGVVQALEENGFDVLAVHP